MFSRNFARVVLLVLFIGGMVLAGLDVAAAALAR